MRNRVAPWFRSAFDELFPPLDIAFTIELPQPHTALIRYAALSFNSTAFLRFSAVGGFGLYFDKRQRPLSVLRWAQLSENEAYRRIEMTPLGPKEFVSTVWVGVAGLWEAPSASPQGLFETMIRVDGENDFERWDTEQEARAGHARCVRDARARLARIR